jgi:hypothetical protein
MTNMTTISILHLGILCALAAVDLGQIEFFLRDLSGEIEGTLFDPHMGEDLTFIGEEGLFAGLSFVAPHDPLQFGCLLVCERTDDRRFLKGAVTGVAPDPLLGNLVDIEEAVPHDLLVRMAVDAVQLVFAEGEKGHGLIVILHAVRVPGEPFELLEVGPGIEVHLEQGMDPAVVAVVALGIGDL